MFNNDDGEGERTVDRANTDGVTSPSRRRFLSATAAAGIAATGISAGATPALADEHEDASGSEPFASVEFSNQAAGEPTVVVDRVVLSEGGFVAVHDASLFEGDAIGSVVGVSEYLSPGVHYSVEIELFDVPGADLESRHLSEGEPLVAMPHLDTDDDGEYGFVASEGDEDGPYVDDARPVVDLGLVGSDDGESGPFALVDFENQTADGSTVVVDEVTLSEGGYVAVHDASLLAGEVIESVIGVSEYLDAGEHYEVEIDLFDVDGADFDTDELDGEQLLVPMPHRETDNDEEYDFVESGGSDDGPYVDAGQAVVDLGYVLPEDEDDEKSDGNGDKSDDGNGH
jgi:hypothetical protein